MTEAVYIIESHSCAIPRLHDEANIKQTSSKHQANIEQTSGKYQAKIKQTSNKHKAIEAHVVHVYIEYVCVMSA